MLILLEYIGHVLHFLLVSMKRHKRLETLVLTPENTVEFAFDYDQVEELIITLQAALETIECIMDESVLQKSQLHVIIQSRFANEKCISTNSVQEILIGTGLSVIGVGVPR